MEPKNSIWMRLALATLAAVTWGAVALLACDGAGVGLLGKAILMPLLATSVFLLVLRP